MRFLHMADVHLGVKLDDTLWWARQREEEIFASFCRCLLNARRWAVDVVFISGDLFDDSPTYEQLERVNVQFQKISPIKVVYICGEHDFVRKNSPLSTFSFAPNVFFLKESKKQICYIEEIDTWVYGISYDRPKIQVPLYDSIKPEEDGEGIHILLAHGGEEESPMDFEKLKWSGFDYIALGHIHKQETLVEDLMAYPGSLEPIGQEEEGKHGYMLGEITEEKRIIRFIPHSKIEYITLKMKLSSEMTREQISDKIEEAIQSFGKDNIYTIILEGQFEKNLDNTCLELRNTYRILNILNRTTGYKSFETLYEKNKDNLLGVLIRQSRQEKVSDLDKEAIQYAIKALLYSEK